MEMALAMMIVAILSVGVSSLVRSGVEGQLAQATNDNMQTLSMNIVDDLRQDLRTADSAVISNGGNTLTIVPSGGVGGNIIYTLSGTDLTRSRGGTTKTYNDTVQVRPRLQVACPGGACFSGFRADTVNKGVMLVDNASPQQIVLPNLTVQGAGQNTVIDKNFGAPNYAIRNITLTLTSQTVFQ